MHRRVLPYLISLSLSYVEIIDSYQCLTEVHPVNLHFQSCSSSTECDGLSWSVPAALVPCCWMKRGVDCLWEPRTSCCLCRWTTSPNKNTRLARNNPQNQTCTAVKHVGVWAVCWSKLSYCCWDFNIFNSVFWRLWVDLILDSHVHKAF